MNASFEEDTLIKESKIGEINEDHQFLKDNEFIHSGYRLYFNTSRKIFKSLFLWHNESVNVWSHLLGFLLFTSMLVYCIAFLNLSHEISLFSPDTIEFIGEYINSAKETVEVITEDLKNSFDSDTFNWVTPLESSSKPLQKVSRWPLIVFICSAIICLGMSSLYHLFNAHSHAVYKLMSRFDYAGISILICGSFFPPIYYMYFCIKGKA